MALIMKRALLIPEQKCDERLGEGVMHTVYITYVVNYILYIYQASRHASRSVAGNKHIVTLSFIFLPQLLAQISNNLK